MPSFLDGLAFGPFGKQLVRLWAQLSEPEVPGRAASTSTSLASGSGAFAHPSTPPCIVPGYPAHRQYDLLMRRLCSSQPRAARACACCTACRLCAVAPVMFAFAVMGSSAAFARSTFRHWETRCSVSVATLARRLCSLKC